MFDTLGANNSRYMGNVESASDILASMTGKAGAWADKAYGLYDKADAIAGEMDAWGGKRDEVYGGADQISKDLDAYIKAGVAPKALLDNANASTTRELENGAGDLLGSMANRGIINSSVMNRGMGTLTQNAADAYQKNYAGMYDLGLKGFDSRMNAHRGLLDSYTAGLDSYNSRLSAQKNLTDIYSAGVAGFGTAANIGKNALDGYSGLLGSNVNLQKMYGDMPGSLMNNLMSQYMPAYSFWRDWQNSYDSREDYDTVVSGGGK